MLKSDTKSLIAAVDVGTSKVLTLIATCGQYPLHLVGYGVAPSTGVNAGLIDSIELVSQSIDYAFEQACFMAGISRGQVQEIITGISGSHLDFLNNRAMVTTQEDEVTALDMRRVVDAAQKIQLPSDKKILHAFPQSFQINNEERRLSNPVGMTGAFRLDAHVHLILSDVHPIKNLLRCFEKQNLNIKHTIVNTVASTLAVTDPLDRQQAVLVLDIGSGVLDICVYYKEAIIFTAVLPVGGNFVTQAIANHFKVSFDQAERIKIEFGCIQSDSIEEDEIQLPDVTTTLHSIDSFKKTSLYTTSMHKNKARFFKRRELAQVITECYETILNQVHMLLGKQNILERIDVPIQVKLTGGASGLEGIERLAETIFQTGTQMGASQHVSSKGLMDLVNTPSHATVIGLLLMANQLDEQRFSNVSSLKTSKDFSSQKLKKVWQFLVKNF